MHSYDLYLGITKTSTLNYKRKNNKRVENQERKRFTNETCILLMQMLKHIIKNHFINFQNLLKKIRLLLVGS